MSGFSGLEPTSINEEHPAFIHATSVEADMTLYFRRRIAKFLVNPPQMGPRHLVLKFKYTAPVCNITDVHIFSCLVKGKQWLISP